jgi:hypothetical protein
MKIRPICRIFGEDFTFHEELAALSGHFPRQTLRPKEVTRNPGRLDQDSPSCSRVTVPKSPYCSSFPRNYYSNKLLP